MSKKSSVCIGDRFNSWLVCGGVTTNKGNDYILCRCLCGKEALVRLYGLINLKSKSCGCLKQASKPIGPKVKGLEALTAPGNGSSTSTRGNPEVKSYADSDLKQAKLSASEARNAFSYDVETGTLFWAKPLNTRVKSGDVAGNLDSKGYLRVNYNGYAYAVHRLIWLIHYGVWPAKVIDHKSRVTTDNRIDNLRDVSLSENQWNRKNSGVGKVYRDKRSPYFYAKISHRGVRHLLGGFKTNTEALNAIVAARFRLGIIE